MIRKTIATHFCLLGFRVILLAVLCLRRYEWQGKIEEDSEVLLVSFSQFQIYFQVKETHENV